MMATRFATRTTRVDGASLAELSAAFAGDAMYVASPDGDRELLGLGVAACVTAGGADRFATASREAAALLTSVETDGPVPATALGGFAFHDDAPAGEWWDGFPSLRLVLPRTLFVRSGRTTWRVETRQVGTEPDVQVGIRTATLPVATHDDESAEWRMRVDRALGEIAAGRLEKIVLARSVTIPAAGVDTAQLLVRLCGDRPACTAFLARVGDASFVGSTPETLVFVERGVATSTSLAGSVRRRSNESAAAAARRLEASDKDVREHRFVADAVRDALAGYVEDLDTTEASAVRHFPEVSHLATVHRGRVRPGVSALDLAGRLHPTPAVCGVPGPVAAAQLLRDEPERGWYAGGVGWVDATGDGRFALALRCALVRGDRARLWAGAGIVAGSDPALEWDETDAKLDAMLRMLGERARAA